MNGFALEQLHWPGLVEGALLAWSSAYALLTAYQWLSRRRRGEPRLVLARAQLVAYLLKPLENPEPDFARLPRALRWDLLRSAATGLGGPEGHQARGLAARLGLLERARRQNHSRHWWERIEGARVRAVFGEEDEGMEALLDDPEPLVVAEAAAWVADHPNPERVRRLVARLRAPGRAPFYLLDALFRCGQASEAALLEVARNGPPATQEVCLLLASRLGLTGMLELAPALAESPSPEVRAGVADLAGNLGGESAQELLLKLFDDPHWLPRTRAALGLGRSGFAAAAPALAERLRVGPTPRERISAGLGLRLLGAAGQLYLLELREESGLARLLVRLPDNHTRRWAHV